MMADTARVDAWLWAVRVYKTRSAATAACRAGHVRVGGEHAKAAQTVRIGDEVRVRVSGFERTFLVRALLVKRVAATVAAESYLEISPPPPPRDEIVHVAVRDRGAGRPTKRERRDMEKFLGREPGADVD